MAFSASETVPALRSTAAEVIDTWTVKDVPFKADGGGTEFFTKSPELFNRIEK